MRDRKLSLLKAATRFIYSEGPDYGEFGGCGDSAKILLKVARRLRIPGVKLEYGYAYLKEGRDDMTGDPNAHAWLRVDRKIFDPSQYIYGFDVVRYDVYDPRRADEFQSDLLECIVGLGDEEIGMWAQAAIRSLD